jgi:hypothetical protein
MIPYKMKHSDLCGGDTPLVCRACAAEAEESNKFPTFFSALFCSWLFSWPLYLFCDGFYPSRWALTIRTNKETI